MELPWNSRRSAVYSRHGMVATGQPLASEAGLSILKKGGNAADAAIAIAAALNVVQPTSTDTQDIMTSPTGDIITVAILYSYAFEDDLTSNHNLYAHRYLCSSPGLGGDAFCLFYDAATKQVRGINGSGRCPRALTLQRLADMGFNEQNRPADTAALFCTVPGAAAAWVDTVEMLGNHKLTMTEILEPAIDLAEYGYPVEPVTAFNWKNQEARIRSASPYGGEILLNGFAPKTGEIMRIPTLAATFRDLAANGKKGFYEGRIGDRIVNVLTQTGGFMTMEDLAEHQNTFDTPIHVNYRGVDVYEMPPSGQGITALAALNILEGFTISGYEHNSAEHLHLVIESLRLAFADAHFYVADPTFVDVPIQGMISKDYARQRRQLIQLDRAISDIQHGFPPNTCNTVYFCVVDGEGNACSFINSLYQGFGTCIVPEGCGFSLQNRGANFSLDPASANRLEPGKRPYHTIIPGMALKYGQLWCPFGVMGGFMQPQGHLQVLSNMIDFNMDPQQALDMPRVQVAGGTGAGDIDLEDGITEEVRQKLQDMGHKNPTILKDWARQGFGVGQIITRNPDTGVLTGGSDPRNDGLAIGW